MNNSPGKPVSVAGDRLRVTEENQISKLRADAGCLIGGLRIVEHTIQHCFSIAGVGDDTTWDSPGLLDKNCREVFDALRDCSVAVVEFRKTLEPFRKVVSKHVGEYRLNRPKGFLSHLEKLSDQSFRVLNSLSDICNRGGDFRNWYVSNPPWLDSDWWDGLKIQPRPQLDNLLDALQKRVEEYRPMIESITEGDFCETILQEIEVVALELEPRNTPGNETPVDENRPQNTQKPIGNKPGRKQGQQSWNRFEVSIAEVIVKEGTRRAREAYDLRVARGERINGKNVPTFDAIRKKLQLYVMRREGLIDEPDVKLMMKIVQKGGYSNLSGLLGRSPKKK